MIIKTRGIVLHHIKYSETSVIVTVFTENYGRQSFLIKGVRSKKSKIKANILQPLFLLDMEIYYKANRDLQSVKEIQNAFIFSSIPYDLRKSSIAIFIAEILYKTIREQEANKELFDFLYHTIQYLDIKDKGISNFHIYFLIQLTRYLGFYPGNTYLEKDCYFDLKNGSFVQIKPVHPFYMNTEYSKLFSTMIPFSTSQNENEILSYTQRMGLLEKILEYYYLHNEGVSNIKSLSVLKEVFH
ncbi:MAG: DNA repair protein RecO [Bacteroidetes bacterium GWC2_33_15]|nr:MAG: DNA repair protein RecO [Bacteroidetes bacterium GWA2_33_15]OFX49846.1 MAG: DNA repair protein RecO [Bacteroidetes bacterium GWC2_33_15]OFX65037.1 MAG: DNA repair protein RecO [Bacteroidetes bacterium GWB2_32_14]OFX69001.1 MAG: DNA repair protein RecO [Bacteroidetes bacterium GWD2_33_33]HAN18266.1 DNA repair protein RecO [Bacteroidales bacterium]